MQTVENKDFTTFTKDDVSLSLFSNLDIQSNMENVAKWINEQNLTKSQLISITLQQDPVQHGVTVFWVLTRAKPTDELDTPFPQISVKKFDKLAEFEEQAIQLSKFLEEENRKAIIVAICQLRDESTDSNHQCIFYTDNEFDLPRKRYWLEQIKYAKTWPFNLAEAADFMNDYMAPHQIVGVSTFQ